MARLDPDFFSLRSGVAGEVVQKLTNYRLRLAVLGDIAPLTDASTALRDWVREANRGSTVWFVADLDELAGRLAGRPMSAGVLLRAARLSGAVADLLVADGRVSAIGPDLAAPAGVETVDLEGRTVLPGLWDNHVHFDQWALARQRLDLGSARSAADAVELVGERLRARPAGARGAAGRGRVPGRALARRPAPRPARPGERDRCRWC